MAWQEISIRVPFEFVEPVSYLFSRYGRGLSMEVEQDERILLRTYLQDTSRQRFARIEVGIKLVNILEPLGELKITDLSEDEDWRENWKAHFTLLRVGRRPGHQALLDRVPGSARRATYRAGPWDGLRHGLSPHHLRLSGGP